MKNVSIIVALCIITLSVAADTEIKKFGENLILEKSMVISEVLETPEKFLDKRIRVEGTIVGVCAHKGCWMSLASDQPYQTLRLKVNDGDMVFPLKFKGKYAVSEGYLYKIELTEEQAIAQKKHECEQKGETFDPKSVKGPMDIYQLKPVAVVVREKK